MPLSTSASSSFLQYQYLNCFFRFSISLCSKPLKLYCCLHLHPQPAVSPAAPRIALLQQPLDQWAESSLSFAFVIHLKAPIFQWHDPRAFSSCDCAPSPYCSVPRDFSTLLGYSIVPCAESLWCFLMENLPEKWNL